MIYTIDFTKTSAKVIAKYKKSNPLLYKKIYQLLEDIALHPRTGIGHPEPLKSGDSVVYSRHISAHDRIIYEIYDDIINVLVLEIGGHYDDK